MGITNAQRQNIALYVRSYLLRTAQNLGHQNALFRASARWTHTLNVLKNLQAILDGEKAETETRDVTEIATYFHDIDHYTVQSEYHAARGAETARRFLKKEGYDAEFIKRVSDVIAGHHLELQDDIAVEEQVRKLIAEYSLEIRMLIDADTLDKIGVSNMLQAMLNMGQSHTMLADAAKELTSGWPLQRASAWKEILTTETGKKMGQERFAFYESFLKQVGEEIVMFDPYPQLTQTQEIAQVSQV